MIAWHARGNKIFKKDNSEDHYIGVGKISGLVFLLVSVGFAIILATVTKVNLFIRWLSVYNIT